MSVIRKPTPSQRLNDLLSDLAILQAEISDKADDYLRNCKSYTCRAHAETRAGLVKGAAVMRMDAAKIGALIAKHAEAPNASKSETVAEVTQRPQAEIRPVATSTEPANQDSEPMHLQSVWQDNG